MSNLAIIRVCVEREIFLLTTLENYLPAKYVNKFSDSTLTDLEIEYLYSCLRDGSIKWSHLFYTSESLENNDLVLA